MNIFLACFSPEGTRLAGSLAKELVRQGETARAFASPAIAEDVQLPSTGGVAPWTAEHFSEADALVYIGAAGIAVRAVAPHIHSKHTDPAVLCMDEKGAFAIPLLSGHVGGANRLARRLAALTGGQAVITTGTDVNGLFAVDEWIVRSGMALRNAAAVRPFAEALLAGRSVGLVSEFPWRGELPRGVLSGSACAAGLYIGIHGLEPFAHTVTAVPRAVVAGIGCRRGVEVETLRAALSQVLEENDLRPESLCAIASIDRKKDEPGLMALAAQLELPFLTYSAGELQNTEGDFTASERVLRVTGVDNVCERAAVCAFGGRLIQRKRILGPVTVALALREIELRFEEEAP